MKEMTMKQIDESDTSALERIFHEPNRMAILSALCAASEPLSFTELKSLSGLTDGNLSRHLKALEDANIIRLSKAFVGVKPRTTVILTEKGMKRFEDYLSALSDVLKKAKQAMATDRNKARKPLAIPAFGKKVFSG
jgi:DNA-binding transcriptional ArsR family regulator